MEARQGKTCRARGDQARTLDSVHEHGGDEQPCGLVGGSLIRTVLREWWKIPHPVGSQVCLFVLFRAQRRVVHAHEALVPAEREVHCDNNTYHYGGDEQSVALPGAARESAASRRRRVRVPAPGLVGAGAVPRARGPEEGEQVDYNDEDGSGHEGEVGEEDEEEVMVEVVE